MIKKIGIYLMLVLLVLSGCKKYEEGPAISLRSKEKRLCQKWELKKATLAGDELDIAGEYSHYYWIFKKDGTLEVNIIYDNGGDEEKQFFKWEWINNKESIAINEGSSSSGEESIECEIMKLTFDEFIFENEEDGDRGRFEFEKE